MRIVVRTARSIRNRYQSILSAMRALPLRFWAFLGVFRIGPGFRVGRNVEIVCYGALTIGRDVHIDDGAKIQVGPTGSMEIGDRCYVGRQCVVAATQAVTLGAYTLVAEGCSIRDANHVQDPVGRRQEARIDAEPVVIGADVWIGSGVRVLRGASIGTGAIIGANAVVTGSIEAGTIAVGIPARSVRSVPGVTGRAGSGKEA